MTVFYLIIHIKIIMNAVKQIILKSMYIYIKNMVIIIPVGYAKHLTGISFKLGKHKGKYTSFIWGVFFFILNNRYYF